MTIKPEKAEARGSQCEADIEETLRSYEKMHTKIVNATLLAGMQNSTATFENNIMVF